jgi:hypothetical protein
MHNHWKSIISSKTSSELVAQAVISYLSDIPDFADDHDFDGAKVNCVVSVTNWFATAHRNGSASGGHPFIGCSDILDLMWAVGREQKRSPMSFYPSFAEGDEFVLFSRDGVGQVSKLVTPEAITREIAFRKGALPFVTAVDEDRISKRQCEYWTVRSHGGDIVAIVHIEFGQVSAVHFTRGEDRHGAEGLVTAVIVEMQIGLRAATSIPGFVFGGDGVFYRLDEMPKGLTVRGDVELRGRYPHMESWPSGVTVEGNFEQWGQDNGLSTTPQGLHVKGNLSWHDRSLRKLGDGLVVEGNASFVGSRYLTEAGSDCRFAGDLTVSNEALLSETFSLSGTAYVAELKTRRATEYPRRSLLARALRIKRR